MPNLAQLTDAYYTDPVPAELPVEQPYLGVPADPDGLRRVYINTPSREALPGEVATTGRPEPRPEPGIEENPLEVWAKKKAEGASLWDNLGMAGVEDKSGKSENKLLKKLFGLGGEERYQLWPEKVLREGLASAGEVMDKGTNLGLRREDVTDIPPPDMPTKDSTWLGRKLNISPVAASPQDDIIEKAQAISALAGSGGIGGTADNAIRYAGRDFRILGKKIGKETEALPNVGEFALGSGPSLRPALKYKDRLYKGKEGQQHMDVIPKELYPEFEKMAMSGEDISHYNFGFVNDKGQFLTREKALEYGINTGLIDPHAGKFGALTSTLMADSSKPGTAIEAVAKSNIKNKIIAYHGTTSDFEKFKAGDIGVHFGSPKQANSRLQDISTGTRGDRIIPVEIETKNPLLLKDVSEWEFPENIVHELYNHPDKFTNAELKSVLNSKDKNKALVDLIESKGYDSIKYLNRWEGLDNPLLDAEKLTDSAFKKLRPEADYSYIAFKPNSVQSKLTGQTLFADSSKEAAALQANKPTFYSAVEHNVNAIPQAKMTGEQWLGTLSNKPGVKGEELDWTGLKGFLEENKGKPVTKEQIQEHLAANKVELKEVNKGAIQDPIVRYLKDDYQTTKEIRNAEDIANAKKYNAHFKETVKGMTDEEILKAARAAENVKDLGDTKYHSYQLPGGPLSRDTEILTNKGWKRIDAVEIGDVVMTRKDEAGILEWQPVQATPKVYAENLYHFFSQSINMRVTENHQMIAKKRRRSGNNELQRLTAKELWGKSEMLVPLTGVWNGGETDKIFGFEPHDLAELFGWYLAEGSYKREGEVKNTIQIAQCREYNPDKCARIEALLNRMGIAWKYYGEAYGIGVKTLNKDLVALFHEQPTSEFKFVPYFFFEQSKSVIQSLLDGLILGDGCTSEQEGRLDKTTFFTKSEQLAGDVQILILMIGKNANVRQRPSGLYCVGIKSKEWSSVDEAKFEIAPYNDFAFCVTVENHAIYVRRNGVAAFTGNSNYREVLMTLPPTKEVWDQNLIYYMRKYPQVTKNIKTLEDVALAQQHNPAFKETMKGIAPEEVLATARASEKPEPTSYKSSHWDEPNILAHVRMNDRWMDDPSSRSNVHPGKVKSLHLEEIQSDWHQQGRDKGYKSKETDGKLKDLKTKIDEAQSAVKNAEKETWLKETNGKFDNATSYVDSIKTDGSPAHVKAADEFNRISKLADENQKQFTAKRAELVREHNDINNKASEIPDAPFKKSWHELALKRMIREAAEKGYDRLSWTPGEAQAARYDLSKSIDKLQYFPETQELKAYKGSNLTSPTIEQKVSPDKLSDVVGKEAAKKLLETKTKKHFNGKDFHWLEGEDLKIGGEGMKGFYDQIIPKALEKIGKEHGVKVKTYELDSKIGKTISQMEKDPSSVKIHYIDIPQSLKDTALQKGFPLFSKGGYMLVPVQHIPDFSDDKK